MNEIAESTKLDSIQKCPICGAEIEKGYVCAPGGVLWLRKKPKIHFITIYDSRFVVHIPAFHALDLPALKCGNCNFIAFIGTRQPSGQAETPKSFLKKCIKCGETIPIASEYCPKCGTKQKEKKGSQ